MSAASAENIPVSVAVVARGRVWEKGGRERREVGMLMAGVEREKEERASLPFDRPHATWG